MIKFYNNANYHQFIALFLITASEVTESTEDFIGLIFYWDFLLQCLFQPDRAIYYVIASH